MLEGKEHPVLKQGVVLADRFRLLRRLGQGGMASVWAAEELATGQRVALKILHERFVHERDLVRRFLREARAAVDGWYSAHVIEVFDAFQLGDGRPVLVLELLEGEPLSAILAKETRLEPGRAVDLVIQVCNALAEVHRQGVIHRDIKPENIFVTHLTDGSEWVKLLDFGIAKLDSASQKGPDLTCAGCTLGTPQYMAPEQLGARADLDLRADVYSTGVVLYELLTGVQPYDGAEGLQELMVAVLTGDVAPISAHRPGLPPALEAVVRRAFAVERSDRFTDAFALAEALYPFRSGAAAGDGAGFDPRATIPSLSLSEVEEVSRPSLAQTRMYLRPPLALPSSGRDTEPSVVAVPTGYPDNRVPLGPGAVSGAGAPPSPAGEAPRGPQKRSRRLWLLIAAVVTLLGIGLGLTMALSRSASEQPSGASSPLLFERGGAAETHNPA